MKEIIFYKVRFNPREVRLTQPTKVEFFTPGYSYIQCNWFLPFIFRILLLNWLPLPLTGGNVVTEILTQYYQNSDAFSEASCIGLVWFNTVSIIANITTICLISLERFISVSFPLKSKRWITVTRVKKVSIFVFSTNQLGIQDISDWDPNLSLPPANEVWGKVICLQACVCPQGGVPDQVPPRDQVHPPGADTPNQVHPSRADTPPRSIHPPGAEHAGRYGQCTGGTHPTGMQSCLTKFSKKL